MGEIDSYAEGMGIAEGMAHIPSSMPEGDLNLIPALLARVRPQLDYDQLTELCEAMEVGVHAQAKLDAAGPDAATIKVNTTEYERWELATVARAGEAARRHILDANIPLAFWAANTLPARASFTSKLGTAVVSISEALKWFDPRRTRVWSSYAIKHMKWGFSRLTLDWYKERGVLPSRALRIGKMLNASHALQRKLGTRADTMQIAAEMTTTTEEVEALQAEYSRVNTISEVSMSVTADDEHPYIQIADPSAAQMLDAVDARIDSAPIVRDVIAAIGGLPDLKRQIMQYHLGLHDGTCYAPKQIADLLGRSTSTIRDHISRSKELIRAAVTNPEKDVA